MDMIFPVPRVSKMLGWLKHQTKDPNDLEKRQNALKIYNKLLPAQKSQFLAKFVQNRKEPSFFMKTLCKQIYVFWETSSFWETS